MTRPAAAPPAGTAPLVYTVTEKEFSRTVTDLARACSWEVFHNWISIRSPAGFPDLVLARLPRRGEEWGRLIFVELKSERGTVSPAQRAWIDLLRATGATALVWYPHDWEDIVLTLQDWAQ